MAKVTEITTDDGEVIKVKRLPLFALDRVPMEILGPFTYQMTLLTGKIVDVIYEGSRWDDPPPKPDIPEWEIEKDSEEWYALREWQLYNAWLTHEEKRRDSMEEYMLAAAEHVIERCLVRRKDRDKIVTQEDWGRVIEAGITEEVTASDLQKVLAATFQGVF